MSAGKLSFLVAAALLAGACGGDDGSTDAPPAAAPSASDADFAARADRICARGEEEISSEFDARYGDDPPPPGELDAFHAETVLPLSQTTLNRLRRLEPPAAEADRFAALLDTVQAAIDDPSGDPTEGGIGGNPFFTVNEELAAEFGIVECG